MAAFPFAATRKEAQLELSARLVSAKWSGRWRNATLTDIAPARLSHTGSVRVWGDAGWGSCLCASHAGGGVCCGRRRCIRPVKERRSSPATACQLTFPRDDVSWYE
ncbi:unnamed protein product [Ixodes pacificus]